MDKMFTQAIVEKGSFNVADRTFVAWASQPIIDRDGEIIASTAWDLKNFKKNPVLLWAHNYSMPPVGRAQWVRVVDGGLKFKAEFAPTAAGQELYDLYEKNFLNSFSVGFDPKDFEDDEKKKVEFIGWFGEKIEKPVRTWTKVELLEISCVPVPACPAALVERAASGEIKTKGLAQAIMETASKTVISYKKYPLDADGAWSGPKEVAAAEVSDLKKMCTWYDNEDADNKSAYKLPHHRADGYTTVWRGVAAAMAALLGARGGVDIPDDDRRGVYNHLRRHYGDFDKEAPEFKHYTEVELKAMEVDMPETIHVAGGDVSGTWEAIETEEADPYERMREEGLMRKTEDGIVPVTEGLWNTIFDNFALLKAQMPEQPDINEIEESDKIELTDEEFSLLVQEQVKSRQQAQKIQELSHNIKSLKAQIRVMSGGIG